MSSVGASKKTERQETVQTVLRTARILDLVAAGQRADRGVLIRGEHGVGKDVLARLIHATSARQAYSFIKVNCAVDAVERCEADLFGHEKGASPRAIRRLLGSFRGCEPWHGVFGRDRSTPNRSCPKTSAHAADRGGLAHRQP